MSIEADIDLLMALNEGDVSYRHSTAQIKEKLAVSCGRRALGLAQAGVRVEAAPLKQLATIIGFPEQPTGKYLHTAFSVLPGQEGETTEEAIARVRGHIDGIAADLNHLAAVGELPPERMAAVDEFVSALTIVQGRGQGFGHFLMHEVIN